MKYTWWILLIVAGVLSLISVYGFILSVGSFGMIALNIMWLFVYTPHKNSKALESVSKPTINLSIIGTYAVIVLMSFLFYFVMKADFMEIGTKLYGETFNVFGLLLFIIGIILFTIGTWFVYQIQQSRLRQ
ncbi:DUF5084 family protein [Staphylococcus epidermidis]|uniref:DUF5084 family protein n=1 Tax=Staphylococcus epidermidis TaxID=1282 RepID=UPI00024E5707|nr:DUF5084 family protein [Staphylococcus epidermidis]EHR97452.1 hypothetical protein SEVCU128_1568 [Staphylococcus epidermidis VCU128]EJE06517.1 hypothetical protein HMPREF9983_02524 [Staphylococcus epidermidis NIHLM023]KSZ62244.1 hypothetical protein RES1_05475 [Staphylococcus epidermidis]KSZ65050.1 hypothetical protein RES3_04640 [Staphylococcus epidermidis]KSZ67383.1 hypothetical protein RES2_03030 [Staphylococcus epidermidis]